MTWALVPESPNALTAASRFLRQRGQRARVADHRDWKTGALDVRIQDERRLTGNFLMAKREGVFRSPTSPAAAYYRLAMTMVRLCCAELKAPVRGTVVLAKLIGANKCPTGTGETLHSARQSFDLLLGHCPTRANCRVLKSPRGIEAAGRQRNGAWGLVLEPGTGVISRVAQTPGTSAFTVRGG
jgi:hypothetical protein